MPVESIRAADHLRSRSIGWLAASWLEHFCVHGPGDIQGRPLSIAAPEGIPLSDELTMLLVDSYALDDAGRRLYDSVFFSRPKGADKSGQAARIALFAGFAARPAYTESPRRSRRSVREDARVARRPRERGVME